MPNNSLNNGNKKEASSEITVKEASVKLDISEATVKKYIKDFDLDVGKGSGSKAFLSEDTFQALSEIVKLRANGLSIQEIKELKAQKPSKNILEELEETALTVKNESSEENKAESPLDLLPEGVVENSIADESQAVPTDSADEEKEEGEDASETTETAEDGSEESGKRRRRGFNYRYVERQIASDSKRVYSLRQRLRNPNLSVKDRLFFEEALERRILFLNGWKHILRWMSK